MSTKTLKTKSSISNYLGIFSFVEISFFCHPIIILTISWSFFGIQWHDVN